MRGRDAAPASAISRWISVPRLTPIRLATIDARAVCVKITVCMPLRTRPIRSLRCRASTPEAIGGLEYRRCTGV